METVRAFFALDLSDELKRRIAEVESDVERSGADVKIVEPENLHITMKFLGEIPASRLDEIVKAAEAVRERRFELEAKSVGVFPNRRMVRVVWVGAGMGSEGVMAISRRLDAALVGLGFPKEEKFVPHITIARVRSPKNRERLLEVIDRHAKKVFGYCRIDRLVLKKSVLTGSGPVYSDLKVFPFGE
ncbi:MAG: RNA 2',3'-cyclic phosphodiesterase [Candidatus Verstraetearchaeota archaeon]|nr:RNA 2',3'-cyclic phosphodiesterase [Candidatus Verstraetearchaeota archaeon]